MGCDMVDEMGDEGLEREGIAQDWEDIQEYDALTNGY